MCTNGCKFYTKSVNFVTKIVRSFYHSVILRKKGLFIFFTVKSTVFLKNMETL